VKEKNSIGIIIPNDFIKLLPFGGGSGFIHNIIRYIDNPVIIFGAGVNGTPLWKPQQLNDKTSFISTYPATYPSSFPLRLCALQGYLRNRHRILNSGIKLLYIHSPECALPFLFGKERVHVVFHQHGSGNPVTTAKFIWARNGLLTWLFDYIHKIIYRRADWIIAIDRLCHQQAAFCGAGNKVSLLMNAVDTDKFRPDMVSRFKMRQKNNLYNDEVAIFYVGRLEEVKQIDRLIAGITLLRNSPRVRLFIAGEGTLRTPLEFFAKRLRIEHSVVFLGKIPHDRLPAYYNMADILVLPSKMEGVPMVILESLACGTPVIATKVGGIPDLVFPITNGLLLDYATPETISCAIQEAAGICWNRNKVSGTVAQLGADMIAEKLNKLFNQLLNR